MTRAHLIERMSDAMGVPKSTAQKGLDTLTTTVADAVAEGIKVPLAGLGTFRLVRHAARVGRNPSTGETVEIPSRRKIKFRPSQALADRVAGA